MDYIQFIAGVAIPFIVQYLDKYFPSNKTLKYITILIICLLGAVGIEMFNGTFTGLGFQLFPIMAQIATTAQLIYVAAIKK